MDNRINPTCLKWLKSWIFLNQMYLFICPVSIWSQWEEVTCAVTFLLNQLLCELSLYYEEMKNVASTWVHNVFRSNEIFHSSLIIRFWNRWSLWFCTWKALMQHKLQLFSSKCQTDCGDPHNDWHSQHLSRMMKMGPSTMKTFLGILFIEGENSLRFFAPETPCFTITPVYAASLNNNLNNDWRNSFLFTCLCRD